MVRQSKAKVGYIPENDDVNDQVVVDDEAVTDPKLDDLEEFLGEHTHEEILERLQGVHLGDLCQCQNKNIFTVYGALLNYATNGDQIIIQKLDESVSSGGEDANSKESHIRVDLDPLISKTVPDQTDIIRDMINFKSPATRALLTHPVIETFLNVKWRKIRKYFFVNFLTYILFLIFYSLFLGNIFYRKLNKKPLGSIKFSDLVIEMDKVIFPTDNVNIATTTEEPEAKNVSHRNTFDLCQASNPSLTCAFETILLTLLIILVIQEVLQLITLGPKRYLSEFENILEILVLTLAGCGLGFQYNVYILKWVSAWGICLAYLELIFLLGRYPVLGGSISLMFYTITRHLLQTLSSFLILIVGFAFGFFIMYHQSAGDHFENPFKAALKTLVMAVGEIDFEDLYEGHSDDPYALAYTMALMVCLIIMGSLVLINLLIAIIVSDLGELRQSAHIQELVNSAQHIVHFESAISFLCWPLPKKLRPKTIDPVVKICGHSQCKCENRRMSPDIVERLDKIVKRRQLLERVQNVRESKNIVTSVTKLLRSNSMVATSIKRPTTANGLGQVDSATAASDIVQDILELLILNNT